MRPITLVIQAIRTLIPATFERKASFTEELAMIERLAFWMPLELQKDLYDSLSDLISESFEEEPKDTWQIESLKILRGETDYKTFL